MSFTVVAVMIRHWDRLSLEGGPCLFKAKLAKPVSLFAFWAPNIIKNLGGIMGFFLFVVTESLAGIAIVVC